MIAVFETKDGFEPIGGNPTLTSLDGEVRAPLQTILHHSWTAEDRARFGIFVVDFLEVPEGKVAVGMPRYERNRNGAVVQVRDMEDERPAAVPEPVQKVEAMLAYYGLTIEELRAVLREPIP